MFLERLRQHQSVMDEMAALALPFEAVLSACIKALRGRRKLLVCGNGGSAADAQHFAAEIMGRFQKDRRPWPAVALTTDTSLLTALANDYSFDVVMARQVEGLGQPGDVLIGLSTSGNSRNILEAVNKAREMGLVTVGFLGCGGGALAGAVDHALVVPSNVTARVQEGHSLLIHCLAEGIEQAMTENPS